MWQNTFKKIEAAICDAENISPSDLKQQGRTRSMVLARQKIFFFCKDKKYGLLKKHATASFSALGSKYGQDHATCFHGVKTINNLIETDPIFKNEIETLYNERILKITPDSGVNKKRALQKLIALINCDSKAGRKMIVRQLFSDYPQLKYTV